MAKQLPILEQVITLLFCVINHKQIKFNSTTQDKTITIAAIRITAGLEGLDNIETFHKCTKIITKNKNRSIEKVLKYRK